MQNACSLRQKISFYDEKYPFSTLAFSVSMHYNDNASGEKWEKVGNI
jgi:hypothetical protein